MGDLFQITFACVGRYHLRFTNGVNLVPLFSFGLIHADLDRGTGPGSIDRNDTSWYVLVDPSVEYQVVHNIALTSTLQVIRYNINLSPSLSANDRSSVTLLFGFREGP